MPKSILLSPEIHEAFQRLILQQTGLVIRPSDLDSFTRKISARIDAVKLVSPQDYYLLLESKTQESEEEWKHLVALLTNNESYFFRDSEQIRLLQDHILPNVIQHKQIDKKIRICSAGCSTGEEPYSLAILLKELIPNHRQWDLTILGIDINQIAINSAKKAIYSPWSFRGVKESIKKKYFKQVNQEYHLEPIIKEMVQFQRMNLVQDEFSFNNIDLFICRNVFIYFNTVAIAKVLNKIYHSLNADGYFLTGHAELSGQNLSQFRQISFAQSIIYQRRKEGEKRQASYQPSTVSKVTIPQSKPIKSVQISPNPKIADTNVVSLKNQVILKPHLPQKELTKPSINELLKVAENLVKQERYQAALEQSKNILKIKPNHTDAIYLIAQIHANQGQYQDAIFYCEQLLKIDSLAVPPHYLLARIAEETGKLEEAKHLLKKVIYLDPDSVAAYLDLAYLYEQEGDEKRAIKMYQESLKILRRLPPETPITERGNLTASQLLLQLQKAN